MLSWTTFTLLLVLMGILSSPLPGKSLLPEKETQGNYQAEEHSNVTLTCIPPGHDASPPKTLFMALDSMEPLRRIYEYDSRAKAEPYIDNMFKGRLKCQLIETMSIECLLSDLRLNDTGPYRLVLDVDGRRCHNKSTLLVTPSIKQRQEEPEELVDRGRWGLCAGVGLFLVGIGLLLLRYITGSDFSFSTFISRFKRH